MGERGTAGGTGARKAVSRLVAIRAACYTTIRYYTSTYSYCLYVLYAIHGHFPCIFIPWTIDLDRIFLIYFGDVRTKKRAKIMKSSSAVRIPYIANSQPIGRDRINRDGFACCSRKYIEIGVTKFSPTPPLSFGLKYIQILELRGQGGGLGARTVGHELGSSPGVFTDTVCTSTFCF